MLILSRKVGRNILIGPVGNPTMKVTPVVVANGQAGIEVDGSLHELQIEETVHIGDEISVTLLGTSGRVARLGVAAPADVPIHREEVALRIAAEQRESSARRRDAQFSRQVGRVQS
ncbi:MAG TPA: carbon storage regulator [Aquabacterium sp.]|nr:carbon storage regulator [Aquabacterium sp.]